MSKTFPNPIPYGSGAASDAAEARASRDRAVGHAINALKPIIPAFRGDAIGSAIIELAEELRAYIEGPTP